MFNRICVDGWTPKRKAKRAAEIFKSKHKQTDPQLRAGHDAPLHDCFENGDLECVMREFIGILSDDEECQAIIAHGGISDWFEEMKTKCLVEA